MKKLYRSRSEEMIAGVCGGLAEYLGVDPTIVRLAFVLLFFLGSGGLWVYLILWIIMPLEPSPALASLDVIAKKSVKTPSKPSVKTKTTAPEEAAGSEK